MSSESSTVWSLSMGHSDAAGGGVHFATAQNLDDSALEAPRCRPSDAAAHDVSDQRMAESRVEHGAVGHAADQPSRLGFVDGCFTGELGQGVDVERFAQRQQLQRADHVVTGVIETGVQQLDQARRNRGRSAQLPDVAGLLEGAGIDGALHQMTQEQRIAARGLPHQIRGQPLQAPADHRLDQRHALLLGERLQFDSTQVSVFPQRGDRVGHRLSGADRGEDAAALIHRDLMEQGGRQLVEQVGVIHADDVVGPLGDKGFACCRE